MKILIVTVAGMSTRFSESVGYSCLKCIYHRNGIEESLLYRLLHQNAAFDKYVIVGGFQYQELKTAIKEHFQDVQDKIVLVQNDHYSDYGSGYSLYLGLKAIEHLEYSQVVFAEGDLFFDADSFWKIANAECSIITCNTEPILASKAVAFYYDQDYRIHYIYDSNHGSLKIDEPFLGIFNSGQVWKFADADKMRADVAAISEEDWKGTNLVFIQQYFGGLSREEYKMIQFRQWINCNTVEDYNKCQ